MGDRCYMRVYCLRKDSPLFEQLGFTLDGSVGLQDGKLNHNLDDDEVSAVVSLVDEEANYAHSGDMPKGVPYYGFHGAGGDYGSCEFARLSEENETVGCTHNGGPAVEVDDDGNPKQPQLERVRNYQRLKREVKALFMEALK